MRGSSNVSDCEGGIAVTFSCQAAKFLLDAACCSSRVSSLVVISCCHVEGLSADSFVCTWDNARTTIPIDIERTSFPDVLRVSHICDPISAICCPVVERLPPTVHAGIQCIHPLPRVLSKFRTRVYRERRMTLPKKLLRVANSPRVTRKARTRTDWGSRFTRCKMSAGRLDINLPAAKAGIIIIPANVRRRTIRATNRNAKCTIQRGTG